MHEIQLPETRVKELHNTEEVHQIKRQNDYYKEYKYFRQHVGRSLSMTETISYFKCTQSKLRTILYFKENLHIVFRLYTSSKVKLK